MIFCGLLTFFEINLFKISKFFHEHYQSAKWFGSRSEATFSQSGYGSKLFAKAKVPTNMERDSKGKRQYTHAQFKINQHFSA